MLPQEIFKKEHSESLFPAFLEIKYQFPRQGRSSLKFSSKSKIINENGQMVGDGEVGCRQQNLLLFIIICKFIFYRISKKT